MTHTLHRSPATPQLPGDFVVLMISARGINDCGSAAAMREFLRIASRFAPVNMGDARSGSRQTMSLEELADAVRDGSVVHAVFADEENLVGMLRTLKAADLGLPVTLTGPFDRIEKVCRRLGLSDAPHTVAYSLGVWGKVELLPAKPLHDMHSLCGHALVSHNLLRSVAKDVVEGRATADEGARRLAKPCVCGVFNLERATAVLKDMVAAEETPRTELPPAPDGQQE